MRIPQWILYPPNKISSEIDLTLTNDLDKGTAVKDIIRVVLSSGKLKIRSLRYTDV